MDRHGSMAGISNHKVQSSPSKYIHKELLTRKAICIRFVIFINYYQVCVDTMAVMA